MAIGSANLTTGGLWGNFEAQAIVELDPTDGADMAILDDVRKWFHGWWFDPNGSRPITAVTIRALELDPQIRLPREHEIRKILASPSKAGTVPSGSSAFPNPVTRLKPIPKAPPDVEDEAEQDEPPTSRMLDIMTSPTRVLPGIYLIDTRMAGREKTNSVYFVLAAEPALVETGPSASLPNVIAGLEMLGVSSDDLAHVVVTHVHLDHAGGIGTLSRHFPKATLWAHERGVPHLVEPSKLVASATRAFGQEHMRDVFGTVESVPKQRIKMLEDGQQIDLGNRKLEVIYAPGHAVHHTFLLDSTTAALWTGDGLGIYLPDVGLLRPATPPPDFDLEQAVASISLVAERDPHVLLFSHFGLAWNVQEICHLAQERLRRWAEVVRSAMAMSRDPKEITKTLEAQTRSEMEPIAAQSVLLDRYDLLLDYNLNAAGLMRYFELMESKAGEGRSQS